MATKYILSRQKQNTKTETNPAIEIVDYTVYATESSIGFPFKLALSTIEFRTKQLDSDFKVTQTTLT